jgi:iron complex outermembrane receptor protein
MGSLWFLNGREKNMGNTKLRYAVHAVLAAAAASAVGPAYAQTVPVAVNDTALQEVVVTGSRLAQSPNDVSISPVTSLDSLDIQKSGLVRTEDLLNN